MVSLITEHIDIWTAAQTQKTNGGRGRGNNSNVYSLYGIKKLRELILELAVWGKLVPQDPNDEPASVLLGKIAKEKKRLVKEGKIKKQKPLSDISEDEKSYDLPHGWEWFRVGNVFDFQYGKALPAKSRDDSGDVDVYGSNGIIGKHTEPLIDEPCIVIGRKGSAGALNKALRPSWTTDVAYFLIPLSGFDFDYTFLILQALRLDKLGKGIKPGVNRNEAYSLVSTLPPLAEQHRIVAKVDELMALCDQLEQQQTNSNATHQTLVETLLATLTTTADQKEFAKIWQRIANHFGTLFTTEHSIDQLKQTILQLAVMGKLAPQDPNDEPASILLEKIAKERKRLTKEGKIKKQKTLPKISEDEKLFDLPEGWEWTRLGDVTNYGISDKAEPGSVDEDTWVLELEDVEKETSKLLQKVRFADRQFRSSKNRFCEGDVIYGKLRPYLDKVIIADEDGVCTTEMIPLRGYANITPQYLRLVMKSPYFIWYANESTHGMNLPRMGTDKARLALFPMVSETEQHRIVAKVDELMAICDALQTRLNDAQTTQAQLADAIVEQAVA